MLNIRGNCHGFEFEGLVLVVGSVVRFITSFFFVVVIFLISVILNLGSCLAGAVNETIAD